MADFHKRWRWSAALAAVLVGTAALTALTWLIMLLSWI